MPRCQWIKADGKRCLSKGNPYCTRHKKISHPPAVDAILGTIFNQSPVKKVVDKLSNILDNVGVIVDKAAVGEFDTILGKFKQHKVKFEVPVADDDPRLILGFRPGEKITVEVVKQKRKELAKKLHSDFGGSDVLMQKVNVACDKLLKELKK